MTAPEQLNLDTLIDSAEDRPFTSAERARFRWQAMRAHLNRWEGGRADTFADRRDWHCIRVGETCPGCGYRFPAHSDAGNMHRLYERPDFIGPVICDGLRRALERRATA